MASNADMTAAARAQEEAVDRFSLVLSGEAEESDLEEIEGWRRADPANDAAWRRLTSIWEASASAAEAPDIKAMRSAALASRQPAPASPPSRWNTYYPFALAASVALMIGSLAWFGANGLLPWQDRQADMVIASSHQWSADERTRIGEIRSLQLGDGSVVTLNTNSALQTALSDTGRAVRISRGEAYFKVAKDADRPFSVQTGDMVVTALGTEFSVRNLGDAVIITLVEGRVRVATADGRKEQILTPGMQLKAVGSNFQLAEIDAARAVNWTSGMLDFHQARLDAVVAEVNRYSTRQITLVDPSLAASPVSGVFPVGDQDRFIDMLVASKTIQVQRRTASSVELDAP